MKRIKILSGAMIIVSLISFVYLAYKEDAVCIIWALNALINYQTYKLN